MAEMTINVHENGRIEFIWDDALSELIDSGNATIQRASHVEPAGKEWFADMAPSGGPVLGPYAIRAEAIAAEIQWLKQNRGL